MLKDFLLGDHEERPWYAHDLDLADYHFCTGRWAQEAKEFDKAIDELQAALRYCDGVMMGTPSDPRAHPNPPDVVAIVRAYRRYSGCVTQKADVLFNKHNIERTVTSLISHLDIKESVAKIANDGFDSAQTGLEHGRDKPECYDNMRALVYNALLSLGYQRLALGAPLPISLCSKYTQLSKDLQKYDIGERDWDELRTKEYGYYLIEEDIAERAWLNNGLNNED